MKKDKTKEKTSNPFYKKWWFWIIVIGTILCIANFIYAIWGYDNNKSNILTVISGWISGIATFTVGMIAFYQTQKIDTITKKQNFITQITTYINDFQVGYYKYIKIDKVADLNNEIIDCLSKPINKNRVLKIKEDTMDIAKESLKFVAILKCGFYSSNKVIKLYEKINKMHGILTFNNMHDLDRQNIKKTTLEACFKNKQPIAELMETMEDLAEEVISDYNHLRMGFLQDKNTDMFLIEVEQEQKKIIDFFSNLAKEQDNGQVEDGK